MVAGPEKGIVNLLCDFMGIQRKELKVQESQSIRCPKCGLRNLVYTRYILSVTLDSIISGILAAMVVLWIGYFIGVDRKVSLAAALVASVPFVIAVVRRRSCRQCEIEFGEPENGPDHNDLDLH